MAHSYSEDREQKKKKKQPPNPTGIFWPSKPIFLLVTTKMAGQIIFQTTSLACETEKLQGAI